MYIEQVIDAKAFAPLTEHCKFCVCVCVCVHVRAREREREVEKSSLFIFGKIG